MLIREWFPLAKTVTITTGPEAIQVAAGHRVPRQVQWSSIRKAIFFTPLKIRMFQGESSSPGTDLGGNKEPPQPCQAILLYYQAETGQLRKLLIEANPIVEWQIEGYQPPPFVPTLFVLGTLKQEILKCAKNATFKERSMVFHFLTFLISSVGGYES